MAVRRVYTWLRTYIHTYAHLVMIVIVFPCRGIPRGLTAVNTQEHSNRGLLWGDKDTFPLSFALAGKAHDFALSHIPPGVGIAGDAHACMQAGACL